jgi:hypothetical protein
LLSCCAVFCAGREVAGGSHCYADVEELFGKLHSRLQQALEQTQQQQPAGNNRQLPQHVRFDRWGDEDEDDEYLDASNRSPTYKASIRQQRNGSRSSNSRGGGGKWGTLELLLDCQEAIHRSGDVSGDGAPRAAAAGGLQVEGGWQGDSGRQQQQRRGKGAGGGGQQWKWGNGADRAGVAAAGSGGMGGSRKRERWER